MQGRNEWLALFLGLSLGFLLCGTIYSAMWDVPSQAPAHWNIRDSNQRGDTQNRPAELKDGKPPLAVQIIPTEADKEKARDEADRAERHAGVEDDTLNATWWLVRITGALALITGGLFLATYKIASDTQNTAARVRSIVRGAGQRIPAVNGPDFHIEVSNAGEGPAVIKKISWRFSQFNDFTVQPYIDSAPSDEVVASRVRSQAAKIVLIPSNLTDPMIFVRLEYFDVNRRKDHTIEYVMRITPLMLPRYSVFPDLPAGFLLEDTFPLDTTAET